MTISKQSIPTTLRPLVDGLGPKHQALVVHLRTSFDKNKARGRYTGFRELQEWSYATTVRMASSVISRVLSANRFPDYRETCHLWELFTNELPTRKLEHLWRQAASERGIGKKEIDGQIRKAIEKIADPTRGKFRSDACRKAETPLPPSGGTVATDCGCG